MVDRYLVRSTSGHLSVPHGWVASDNILVRSQLTVMRTQTQRTLLVLLHSSTTRLMIYMAGSEIDSTLIVVILFTGCTFT